MGNGSTIESRVLGTKSALELISTFSPDLGITTSERAYHNSFWKKMKEVAESKLPPDPHLMPTRPTMTEEEAQRYEGTLIKFGAYEGDFFSHVPISYLLFIHTSSESLGAYLRSDRGQKRQEE